MALSPKLQALVHAGLVKGDPETLSPDLLARIESLSDDEITHIIAAKAKLGDDHTGGAEAMVFL